MKSQYRVGIVLRATSIGRDTDTACVLLLVVLPRRRLVLRSVPRVRHLRNFDRTRAARVKYFSGRNGVSHVWSN